MDLSSHQLAPANQVLLAVINVSEIIPQSKIISTNAIDTELLRGTIGFDEKKCHLIGGKHDLS